ncbi:unnamed protein product [Cyclocybe aegerita]|uniref:Cytochrome P450 n=1 Tax=Cyclocybe aegerita TaxID=1973307 RepID=A0A8S0WH92_CYCAE|nr:unnamed protein product [Cyclocybe aegerita]
MAVSAPVQEALIIQISLAVALHLWFKKHEPKSISAVFVILIGLSAPSALLLLFPHFDSLVKAVGTSFVTLVVTLLSSILVYRLSPFHPLSCYPGPWQCKATKLWGAYIAWQGKPHVYYKSLHDVYGPIVRIGPNEISVAEVDMLPNILGTSGMPKGPMWEGRSSVPSKKRKLNDHLTSTRDLRRHAQLRRPWNAAFKPAAVANYTEFLIARSEQFVTKLKEVLQTPNAAQRVDIALWINYLAFDVVGDLAFGGVYSFLVDGDRDGILRTIRRGIFPPSVSQHVPWLQEIMRKLPFLGKDSRKFGQFGLEQGKKRAALSDTLKRKDLFHYLIEDDPNAMANPIPVITSNALLAIVAGSDTSTSVLCNIVYYLLQNPEYLVRLRSEIDDAYPSPVLNEAIDVNSLGALPLLNGVVNEALRLQPPIASSLQRAPALGSGGKLLAPGLFIPEGTAVQVSPYIFHRDPRYFSPRPDEFWPDRWISKDPSLMLNRAAFIPFSVGPANCPGKPLAMMELRYITCLLVRTFDMSFADGYDHAHWEEGLFDHFVMLKGELPLKLQVRVG